jgi:hypothetical protein
MKIQAGNQPIKGRDVEVLRAKPGVTQSQLEEASKKNGHSEIIAKTASGDLFVVAGRNLHIEGAGLPTAGTQIQAGALQGTVVATDAERDRFRVGSWIAAGGLAGAAVVGGVLMGEPTIGRTLAENIPLLGTIVGAPIYVMEMCARGIAMLLPAVVGTGIGNHLMSEHRVNTTALEALGDVVSESGSKGVK